MHGGLAVLEVHSRSQRYKALFSDDDVVQEWNSQQVTDGEQTSCHLHVFETGLGIPAWVVVRDDDRSGGFAHRGTEDLAGMDQGSGQRSLAHRFKALETMLSIEQENQETLAFEPSQIPRDGGINARRRTHRNPQGSARMFDPTPEVEGRRHPGCGDRWKGKPRGKFTGTKA